MNQRFEGSQRIGEETTASPESIPKHRREIHKIHKTSFQGKMECLFLFVVAREYMNNTRDSPTTGSTPVGKNNFDT